MPLWMVNFIFLCRLKKSYKMHTKMAYAMCERVVPVPDHYYKFETYTTEKNK